MKNIRISIWSFGVLCFVIAALGNPQDMPQPKKRVDPAYPEILKRAGIEADVEIKVSVNEQGVVEKAETVSATNENFVDAAMNAAAKWEFIPAKKDGKPIKAEVTIPFKFRLTNKEHGAYFKSLVDLSEHIKQFLKGDVRADIFSVVDPSAYIVIGNKYVNLRAALADRAEKGKLIAGNDANITSSHLETDDSESAAYFVLQSMSKSGKSNRFHTVVLMKDKNNAWHIKAWHTSP